MGELPHSRELPHGGGGELPKLQVVPLGWEVPPRWQLHPGGELQHLPLDPRHHVPDGGLGQCGGEGGYLGGLQGQRHRSGEGGKQPGSHRWRHGWDDEGGVLRLRKPRKPSGETLCGKKGAGLSSGALGSPAGPQPREEREPAAGPAMVAGEWGGCLGNAGNGGSVPTADQPLADILGRTAGFGAKQAAQRKTWPSPAGFPSHAALAMPRTLPHHHLPGPRLAQPRTSFSASAAVPILAISPHGTFPATQTKSAPSTRSVSSAKETSSQRIPLSWRTFPSISFPREWYPPHSRLPIPRLLLPRDFLPREHCPFPSPMASHPKEVFPCCSPEMPPEGTWQLLGRK